MTLTERELLELRYDGPIPQQADEVRVLRQRVKLFRRMAMDHAAEARRQDRNAQEVGIEAMSERHQRRAGAARRNLADARRAHAMCAAELGRLTNLL